MKSLFNTRQSIVSILFSMAIVIIINSCKKDNSVYPPPPPLKITISSVKPLTGKQGDTIFIIGTNFNLNPALDTVKFNGIVANVFKAKSDTLFVIVPAGNATGVITVNRISAPPPDFTVLSPESAYVYIGGSGYSTATGHQVAQYWRNGTPVILSDGKKNDNTCGIIGSGSDIYLAGNQFTDSSAFPEYWKNGTSVIINEPFGQAYSLAVSGSDVYVAGAINGSPNFPKPSIAAYWKNGTTVKLTDGSRNAYATGIAVSGNDVYVCGVELNTQNMTNKNVAKIWKNGIATNLSDGKTIARASSIMVTGNDVYVAGFVQDPGTGIYVAKYWKNGVGVNLSDGTKTAYGNSIFISGNDIYVAGIEKNTITGLFDAKYWKNGNEVKLTNGANGISTTTTAIFVFENDVYVLGEFDFPALWKNGIMNLSNTKEVQNSLYVQNR